MLPNGQAVRRSTHIDIPLEIGLPHFIQDDTVPDGAGFGNFKLSLQSVVCHRGDRVDSGHYVSLIRGEASNATNVETAAESSPGERWMLFDDLANERIRYVDIEKALREESPYLLFYQVQPIEGDPGNIEAGEKPPSYTSDGNDSGIAGLSQGNNDGSISNGEHLEVGRPSFDGHASDGPRGRSSITSERRLSVAFTDTSFSSARGEVSAEDPIDGPRNTKSFPLSRRGSKTSKKTSKSRPGSQSGDNRISASFTRLAGRLAKEKPAGTVDAPHSTMPRDPTVITASEAEVANGTETAKTRKESKEKVKNISAQSPQLVKGKKKTEKPDRECTIM